MAGEWAGGAPHIDHPAGGENHDGSRVSSAACISPACIADRVAEYDETLDAGGAGGRRRRRELARRWGRLGSAGRRRLSLLVRLLRISDRGGRGSEDSDQENV